MDFREIGCEVDGTGSASYPVSGFGVGGIEPSCFGTTVSYLVN